MRWVEDRGVRKSLCNARAGGLAMVLWCFMAACGRSAGNVMDAKTSRPDSKELERNDASAAADAFPLDLILPMPDSLEPTTKPAVDSGDSALPDGGDAAFRDGGEPTCTVPDNTAPAITETVVADPPPVAKGGTIEPGTYYETAWVRYNSMAMPVDAGRSYQHRQTTMIDSAMRMAVSTIALDTGEPLEYLIQLEYVSPDLPATLNFAVYCPLESSGSTYEYDAVAGSVTFYHTDSYGPYGYTLTKQ